MNTLLIDDKQYNGPGSWHELTHEQVERIFALDLLQPMHVLRLHLIKIIYGAPWKRIFSIAQEDLPKLELLTQFVINEPKLLTNPVPMLNIEGHVFHGPANTLENICFGEWIFSDMYLKELDQAKPDALEGLIATLWRPGKENHEIESEAWDGDVRKAFNKFSIERRIPLMKKLKPAQKKSMLYFITCSRKAIMLAHPDVFIAQPQKKIYKTMQDEGNWIDVLLTIGGGKFGNVYQTELALFSDVLIELERLIKLKNAS